MRASDHNLNCARTGLWFGPVTASLLLIVSAACRSVPLQVAVCDPIQLVSRNSDVAGLKLNLLYGRNRNVTGIDAGVVSVVDEKVIGLQTGVLLCHADDVTGIQMGALACHARNMSGLQIGSLVLDEDTMTGVQMSWLLLSPVSLLAASNACGLQLSCDIFISAQWVDDDVEGAQIAVAVVGSWNVARNTKGVQVAFGLLSGMNTTGKNLTGVQLCGLIGYNEAGTVKGVQLGPLNLAKEVTGVQIGLANYCQHLRGAQIGILNISSGHFCPFVPILNVRF
jgi:hypothetical protein